jgi:LysR family transcriptional regulator, low CO2-responsive transcriptional regulator
MSAPLSLTQVRVFVAVARYNSFTHAAEELRVSQPYVSGQISALEASLGLQLFNRIGRKAYLSEAGKIYFPYAKGVLDNLKNAERSLEEFRGLVIGHVTIAASSTPGAYILPGLLRQFVKDYPGVELTIQIKDKLHVEQLLLKQQAELGVVASARVSQKLVDEVLAVDKLLLVVSNSHRWASACSVSIHEIEQERLIVRERSSGTRILIEEELKNVSAHPFARLEFSSNDAIKEAVAEGLGVAFLSERTVRTDIALGRIVSVPLGTPCITRTISLCTLQGQKLSPAAAVLRNVIVADFISHERDRAV